MPSQFSSMLLPIVLIGLVFYFMIFRPQQREVKNRRLMLSQLQQGDKVVTAGGIIGTIYSVEGDEIILNCGAPNIGGGNYYITFARSSVMRLVSTATQPLERSIGPKAV